jgi:hypothetical protein
VQPAYAERLRLIIRLLRDGETLPVLMTQPTIGGTGQDPTTGKALSHLWYGEFFNKLLTTYNDTMRQVAMSDHVHLIDLDRLLPKDTKYYWDPVHHTDAGVEKIAQLVTPGFLPILQREFPSFSRGTCKIDPAHPA